MSAEQLTRFLARPDRPFASSIASLPRRFRPTGICARVHIATTGREPGNWLVAVDNSSCRVIPGSVPRPDARLYTDSQIGHSVLTGKLSVEEAVASRLLDFDGEPELLRRFRDSFVLGELP